jgi:hypothetical protein
VSQVSTAVDLRHVMRSLYGFHRDWTRGETTGLPDLSMKEDERSFLAKELTHGSSFKCREIQKQTLANVADLNGGGEQQNQAEEIVVREGEVFSGSESGDLALVVFGDDVTIEVMAGKDHISKWISNNVSIKRLLSDDSHIIQFVLRHFIIKNEFRCFFPIR